MRDRLQTLRFGPYFGSFSAHSYGYERSNDPKSVRKPLDFRLVPILRQPASLHPERLKSLVLSSDVSDHRTH